MRMHGCVDILHQLIFLPLKRADEEVVDSLVAVLVLVDVPPPGVDVYLNVVKCPDILLELDDGAGECIGAHVGAVADAQVA